MPRTYLNTILAALLCCCWLETNAQNCQCAREFEWLTKKIEQNYAGFQDKVNTTTADAFQQHTELYRQKCQATKSDTACLHRMEEWARWFKDRHIYFNAVQSSEKPEDIRSRFAKAEKIDLSEAAAKAWLDKEGRDSIEGIWQNDDGNYRVAIVQHRTNLREFAAVILKADSVWWMPGQVKFELKKQDDNGSFPVRYFMRDHSGRVVSGQRTGAVLSIGDLGNWYKVYPGNGKVPPPPKVERFSLRALDQQTLVLTVKTMDETHRQELRQLEKANRKKMKKTPYLIIDCRGNGGGSDITFNPLKKYLFTGRVRYDGSQTWATPDNTEKYTRLKSNKNYPWYMRLYFAHTARKLKRNKGEFVGKTKPSVERPFRKTRMPQQVAVLVDKGCASSCEGFVAFARQSKKVTLMGQNSAGISDYGNLHHLPLPCGLWELYYPTSRSVRVAKGEGIDNVGYPPKFRIEPAEGDWIQYAAEKLRTGKQ